MAGSEQTEQVEVEDGESDMCQLPPKGAGAVEEEVQRVLEEQRAAAAEEAAFSAQSAAAATVRKRYKLTIEYCAACGSAQLT
jgi:hypothetical protein